MKTRIMFALIVSAILSGCVSPKSIPGVSFDSWQHDGNYGPVTTHYEAHGAVLQTDGKLRVDAYSGQIKVLGGYGVADTMTKLEIDPKAPAPAIVIPTETTK